MRAIPLLAVLLMFLIGVPSAQAGPVVNRAASALSSDPVYVAPDARPSVTSAEAAMLRSDIAKDHSGPTYIAILPASAGNEEGGDPTAVALAIGRALGSGTVAVVVGGEFRAVSSVLPRGDAAALSRQAFQAHRSQGIAVTVGDFLRRVGGVLSSRAGGQSPSPGGQGAGGSSAAAPALLGLLVLGAAGYMFFRSRQRRRREAVELTEVREHAREDLIALGDDIRALDLDVQMPDVDPRVREDYGRAVDAYQAADRDLQRARRPADLGRVPPIWRKVAMRWSARARVLKDVSRLSAGRRVSLIRGMARRYATCSGRPPAVLRGQCRPAPLTRCGSRLARIPTPG